VARRLVALFHLVLVWYLLTLLVTLQWRPQAGHNTTQTSRQCLASHSLLGFRRVDLRTLVACRLIPDFLVVVTLVS
jgi:hypothetical protein